jgi:CheY-like chemotaxis protein
MTVLAIFSASHCQEAELVQQLATRLGFAVVRDNEVLAHTAQRFSVSIEQLHRSMVGQRSVFNRFTHDKERHIAYVRATLGELIKPDKLIVFGAVSQLLPSSLSHVLRIGVAAKHEYRLAIAIQQGLSDSAAHKAIAKSDEELAQWTLYLSGLNPWDKKLYDVFVPMDSTSLDDATNIIVQAAAKPAVASSVSALQAVDDFALTCRIYIAMAEHGQEVDVESKNGIVTLTLNRYNMRLEHHKQELARIASSVAGVKQVNSKLGPHYKQPHIYRNVDFELPPKILLVDDEREFVLTLSERLETRNLESAIAYDGEEALAILESDTPDVMVLDLKMPGIDGLSVLQRVKQDKPMTEVIILTGHGSDHERDEAMRLGAFAYLHKPVDIDILAETMKQAYRRLRENQAQKSEHDDADQAE